MKEEKYRKIDRGYRQLMCVYPDWENTNKTEKRKIESENRNILFELTKYEKFMKPYISDEALYITLNGISKGRKYYIIDNNGENRTTKEHMFGRTDGVKLFFESVENGLINGVDDFIDFMDTQFVIILGHRENSKVSKYRKEGKSILESYNEVGIKLNKYEKSKYWKDRKITPIKTKDFISKHFANNKFIMNSSFLGGLI